MNKKIKTRIININHWFESKQDMELYRKALFPDFEPQTPALKQSESPTLWIDEAVEYLGLDRIGLKRPDKAIHRLINKGA